MVPFFRVEFQKHFSELDERPDGAHHYYRKVHGTTNQKYVLLTTGVCICGITVVNLSDIIQRGD